VIEKKSPNVPEWPWSCSLYKGNVQYSADMCPNTLEYLSRVVHIDIPPQMSEEDCRMIAKAINKVAAELA
jgi:8-amino-3,8-dideoxy-alpha-D-manno-octulosonate transaminase